MSLTLTVGGQSITGWTETRVTRGIERCTGDFDIVMTDPGATGAAAAIATGAACQIKLGSDLVLSGWVDRVNVRITAREHTLRVTGRGKCEDLIDAAAQWPGGQITGANVLEVAQKLAGYFNIKVAAGVSNLGPTIPQFNLTLGETPWQIIERLCRFAQLIAYEQPDGSLLLTQAGATTAASDFVQGLNILEADVTFAQDQCFGEYDCFLMSTETLSDVGEGGNQIGSATDPNVDPKRNRKRYIIAETPSGGQNVAQARAVWESVRRRGQATRIEVTVDSWRDGPEGLGSLWLPNTLVAVDMPAWKVPAGSYCIGEVSYLRGAQGTTARVVLMPKEAFLPEPILLQPALPDV
jgi:prophage tail gpP-like protein